MIKTLLSRHVFYPACERMCGRDSVPYAIELQDSQWRTAQELTDLQRNKLRALARHAVSETTFYARWCAQAGLTAVETCAEQGLEFWPVMTREAIRENDVNLVACSMRHALTTARTSGSTGTPLVFKLASRRRRADVAARLRCHAWFGLRPGDPTIYLWGTALLREQWRVLKAVRDWLINERLLDAFDLSQDTLEHYANVFLHMRPRAVYSYASTLWRFAQFVGECRPELHGCCSNVAFATGEELLPEWRTCIENALGCRVIEEYGTREGGMIAHQCAHGSYHIMSENVIVEILDDDDRRLPVGCEGRIVVTNLESVGMPFMRYDTGDRGSLRSGACACGINLPMMDKPLGRAFEFLCTTAGQQVSGRSVSRDMAEINGVAQYRLTQEAVDRVCLDVVPHPGADVSDLEHNVRWTIRSRLGSDMDIKVCLLNQLHPEPSGKWRYIINRLDHEELPTMEPAGRE